MICGFIHKDFTCETQNISKVEAFANANDNKYVSVNIDKEYYIFVDREIYIEENLGKISILLIDLNKELMFKNK